MAERKKKHQTERVLEPIVKPGEPIKAPAEAPIPIPARSACQTTRQTPNTTKSRNAMTKSPGPLGGACQEMVDKGERAGRRK